MKKPLGVFPSPRTSNYGGQKSVLFQHYGLTEHDLERYLAAALSAGGEYADLYFEYLSSTSLMVDESMVKSAPREFRRDAAFAW